MQGAARKQTAVLAPASWRRCSLARVRRLGRLLNLCSSAWGRSCTVSRTTAAAKLAWLGGALRSLGGTVAGKGLQRDLCGNPDRREGRAAGLGHQASRRENWRGPAQRSVAHGWIPGRKAELGELGAPVIVGNQCPARTGQSLRR